MAMIINYLQYPGTEQRGELFTPCSKKHQKLWSSIADNSPIAAGIQTVKMMSTLCSGALWARLISDRFTLNELAHGSLNLSFSWFQLFSSVA